MALTRVSPALFQVSNNITSVTVGGSANTISLTFDSNGIITGASNNAVSVANTAITGNIISSQIAPSVTLTTPIISGNLNLDSAGTTGIRAPSANTITFHTAGTEDVRIDANGNTGIGTASPTVRLHASDSANYVVGVESSSAYALLGFKASGSGGTMADPNVAIGANANDLYLRAGGTERARIDSSGNLQFNSGYGSVATAFAARAWVNFNGTGTPSVRASGNVSSITDNGTGNFTVNFTTAMPDVDYSVSGMASDVGGTGNRGLVSLYRGVTTPAVGSFRIFSFADTTQTDNAYIYVSVFR